MWRPGILAGVVCYCIVGDDDASGDGNAASGGGSVAAPLPVLAQGVADGAGEPAWPLSPRRRVPILVLAGTGFLALLVGTSLHVGNGPTAPPIEEMVDIDARVQTSTPRIEDPLGVAISEEQWSGSGMSQVHAHPSATPSPAA